MKHRVRVQVPVVGRGFFGRKRVVYEKRTILVDSRTYRRIAKEQRRQESGDFLGFIDQMETLHAIFDD